MPNLERPDAFNHALAGLIYEKDVCLLSCFRAVLDAAGDDEQLTGPEIDVAVAKLDRQASHKDEEEVIGIGVCVPHELALHLDQLELVIVELADDLGLKYSSKAASFAARSTFSFAGAPRGMADGKPKLPGDRARIAW
jgi:hypothetical protein